MYQILNLSPEKYPKKLGIRQEVTRGDRKSSNVIKTKINLSAAKAELVVFITINTEFIGIIKLMAEWRSDRTAKIYKDSNEKNAIFQRRIHGE